MHQSRTTLFVSLVRIEMDGGSTAANGSQPKAFQFQLEQNKQLSPHIYYNKLKCLHSLPSNGGYVCVCKRKPVHAIIFAC